MVAVAACAVALVGPQQADAAQTTVDPVAATVAVEGVGKYGYLSIHCEDGRLFVDFDYAHIDCADVREIEINGTDEADSYLVDFAFDHDSDPSTFQPPELPLLTKIAVSGGPGDDGLTVLGDFGAVFTAGSGDDYAEDSSGDGADVFRGGPGEDKFKTGNGADTAIGGGGDDEILGGRGNDDLTGSGGRDVISGGSGRDRCRAEAERHCER